jgi:Domain of unknown function (DUF6471)
LEDIFHDRTLAMSPREQEWADKARRHIKAELRRAGIGYKDLVQRLHEHGIEETEASITGKLNRGTFSVAFFLACLTVLGITALALEDL